MRYVWMYLVVGGLLLGWFLDHQTLSEQLDKATVEGRINARLFAMELVKHANCKDACGGDGEAMRKRGQKMLEDMR